jgi:hypothetical protein
MKEFVKPAGQDVEHRANPPSPAEARLRLVNPGTGNSPRASVAFSALAAVTWLQSKVASLVTRIGIGPRRNLALDAKHSGCTRPEGAAPEGLRETKTIAASPF